jgi:hypothetical protein
VPNRENGGFPPFPKISRVIEPRPRLSASEQACPSADDEDEHWHAY